MIVKEQEEMKYYNENDDRSDISSPQLASPTSPVEKVPLGRLGSGLFSSIQKQSEERGITSPITKKPIFTLNDVQEMDTSNDIGPPGGYISEDKPWYETGSLHTIEPLSSPPAGAKEPRSNYRSPSKSSINYKKKEHIYESIDDVLAELKQNQGSSPNYATLHKWTCQLTTLGSPSSSSSGSAALDSKNSSSQISSRSTDDHDSANSSASSRPLLSEHDNVSSSDRQLNKSSSKPNSGAKERRSHSYSTTNVKMSMPQDGSSTPPSLPTTVATGNQLHSTDTTTQVRQLNKKLSFPEVTIPTASSQVKHNRQPSGPELLSSSPTATPEVMVRSHSARWIRRQSHQPGRSQSPTLKTPPVNKDGYLTPQLSRNVQNGVQSPNSRYSQTDDFNPLAQENSISLNFSNEVLSLFNFQQPQQSFYPTAADKHSSRTASSSSTSSHGRRSIPLKPSPSPDLCVNPLGGPRISPPPVDNQTSVFCHVPRRQSGNVNLTSYKSTSSTGEVLPKLSSKRSISGSVNQNNLLPDTVVPEYHPAASSTVQQRNSLSYQNMAMPSSPGMMRRDSNDPNKRDIMDCPSSPRFPKRSLNRSPGQAMIVNAQTSQPRIAKFTAPPPPTVAPPKLHHSSSDFRPAVTGHVRPSPKVEQTWC